MVTTHNLLSTYSIYTTHIIFTTQPPNPAAWTATRRPSRPPAGCAVTTQSTCLWCDPASAPTPCILPACRHWCPRGRSVRSAGARTSAARPSSSTPLHCSGQAGRESASNYQSKIILRKLKKKLKLEPIGTML